MTAKAGPVRALHKLRGARTLANLKKLESAVDELRFGLVNQNEIEEIESEDSRPDLKARKGGLRKCFQLSLPCSSGEKATGKPLMPLKPCQRLN